MYLIHVPTSYEQEDSETARYYVSLGYQEDNGYHEGSENEQL